MAARGRGVVLVLISSLWRSLESLVTPTNSASSSYFYKSFFFSLFLSFCPFFFVACASIRLVVPFFTLSHLRRQCAYPYLKSILIFSSSLTRWLSAVRAPGAEIFSSAMAATQTWSVKKKIIDRFPFASREYTWPTWLLATLLYFPVISLSFSYPDGWLMDFFFLPLKRERKSKKRNCRSPLRWWELTSSEGFFWNTWSPLLRVLTCWPSSWKWRRNSYI